MGIGRISETTSAAETSQHAAERDGDCPGTRAGAGSEAAGPAHPGTSPAGATGQLRDKDVDARVHPARGWVRTACSPGLLAVTAVVPIVVAAVRATMRGWTPTGDDAYSAVRAWDVFSTHVPLLGTWSSASQYTGHQINHPGPLQFDLLAVPVRLLGHGPGTALGTMLVNCACVVVAVWLAARVAGSVGAGWTAACSALLAWSMGSELLFDPWSQHAPLLPFFLCLVAAWAATAGNLAALPVMVVAGSFALHTHLSYSILVPGICAVAYVIALAGLVRSGRAAGLSTGDVRRRVLRWSLVTSVAGLVVWSQPLIEQFTAEGEGNLAALRHSLSAEAQHPTLSQTIVALGGTVALPPLFLPPSFGSPTFSVYGEGRPVWLAATGLIVLAATLALVGVRAAQRGSRAVAAGTVCALVVLLLGLVTTLQMPIRMGFAPTYLRWMWPLSAFVWAVLGLGVVNELRGRWPLASRRALPALAVVTVVAAVAALPTADNGANYASWQVEAFEAVEDDVRAAVAGKGPVLVEFSYAPGSHQVGAALAGTFQRAGVAFTVRNDTLVRQFGPERRFEPGSARTRVVVHGGPLVVREPGLREVASWVGLSAEELAELEDLTDVFIGLVQDNGLALTDEAQEALSELERGVLIQQARSLEGDPEEVVRGPLFRSLATIQYSLSIPVLDADTFPTPALERWLELRSTWEAAQVHVLVGPVSSSV